MERSLWPLRGGAKTPNAAMGWTPGGERADTGPMRLGFPGASWLFLGAGVALAASAVLIPAGAALAEAEYQRDVALANESLALARLDRYREALKALDERDPVYIAHLRSMLDPDEATPDEGTLLVHARGFPLVTFGAQAPQVPAPARVDSMLSRLVMDPSTRLWVTAAAAICLMLGLMPPAGEFEPSEGDSDGLPGHGTKGHGTRA